MEPSTNPILRFFAVPFRAQTYLNLIYLLLAFPLGTAYFIYLVVGFSLGAALIVVMVGLLLLPLVFLGCWALAAFERQLAIWLLREPVPPMQRLDTTGLTGWEKVKAHLANPVTWKSIVFLFAKFPLGILSFVVSISLISLSLVLLTAPITYNFFPLEVWFFNDSYWLVDTLVEALLLFALGLPVGLLSLHLMNGLAWVSGKFARLMLGDERAALAPSAVSTVQTLPAVVAASAAIEVVQTPQAATVSETPERIETAPLSETLTETGEAANIAAA